MKSVKWVIFDEIHKIGESGGEKYERLLGNNL
jgi:hypothetical protein